MGLKMFRPFDRALKRSRDKLFAGLRTFDGFRYFSLLTINEDIVLVTRQFADHRLVFSPHELVGRHLFRNGQYQRALADRVLEIIGQPFGKTLLELGANIGTHSVYLTRQGHFDRLICVEPAPNNIHLLKQNLALNGLAEKTSVIECAVGDRDGTVDFYFDEKNFGASSMTDHGGTSVQVPLRRVDGILQDLDVSPEEIGLVWMDIEGAEPDAIRSMGEIVDQGVPILMEYVPGRYDRAKVSEMTEYLARSYRRCIVFDGKSEKQADIRELPEDTYDILLLP